MCKFSLFIDSPPSPLKKKKKEKKKPILQTLLYDKSSQIDMWQLLWDEELSSYIIYCFIWVIKHMKPMHNYRYIWYFIHKSKGQHTLLNNIYSSQHFSKFAHLWHKLDFIFIYIFRQPENLRLRLPRHRSTRCHLSVHFFLAFHLVVSRACIGVRLNLNRA